MCITAVRNLFIKEINIDAVSRMTLVRCHRVGRNVPYFKRYIIVRFTDYNNKKLIWNKRFDIIDKALSISENYANNIEHRMRLLYPIVKKAKQSTNYLLCSTAISVSVPCFMLILYVVNSCISTSSMVCQILWLNCRLV